MDHYFSFFESICQVLRLATMIFIVAIATVAAIWSTIAVPKTLNKSALSNDDRTAAILAVIT